MGEWEDEESEGSGTRWSDGVDGKGDEKPATNELSVVEEVERNVELSEGRSRDDSQLEQTVPKPQQLEGEIEDEVDHCEEEETLELGGKGAIATTTGTARIGFAKGG